MTAHSFFTVLRDGQVIHSETANVMPLSTAVDAGSSDIDLIFYYTAPLVPTFWSAICQDRGKLISLHGMGNFAGVSFPKSPFIGLITYPPTDPARYSIIHDIYQHPESAAESLGVSEQGHLILSVDYRFTYPELPYSTPYSTPTLSPAESLNSTNSSLDAPSPYNVSCLHYLLRN